MGQTLKEIAKTLRGTDKKVQLIYAFNGSGKTRLSREFKELVSPKSEDEDIEDENKTKVLYYNAFTEDLFYWDNDLEGDVMRKLLIQRNNYTDWVLRVNGKGVRAVDLFQYYTGSKITPLFNPEYRKKDADDPNKEIVVPAFSEVGFSLQVGDDRLDNLKISKGEESNFVWSIFYSILEEAISNIDEMNPSDDEENPFGELEYIFIDDPITSLDDNHLIKLAVDLASLVKSSKFENNNGLKFIIATHNPLFYNVMHNELRNDLYKSLPDGTRRRIYKRDQFKAHRLSKNQDGTFNRRDQSNDRPFAYHLFLLSELEKVTQEGGVEKYHFNHLRNVLEKTATFTGHKVWKELLPDSQKDFANRILNLNSHSAHSGEETSEITPEDTQKLSEIVQHVIAKFDFRPQENLNA